MSQVVKNSTDSKIVPEVQIIFKIPVLDYNFHGGATQESVLDPTTQISARVDFTVNRAKQAPANLKVHENNQNIKACVQDHVWSGKTCVENGSGASFGNVAQQAQCGPCEEGSSYILREKMYEDFLDDWHLINRPEGNGCIETDIEVVNHDMASSDPHQDQAATIDQETFEIVDGLVETVLIDGQLVKVWRDTMLMVDYGHEGRPERRLPWHGLT